MQSTVIQRLFRYLCCALLASYSSYIFAANAAPHLYPGEKLIATSSAFLLTYFEKGDPNKPLILFIPGDANLARVAYGYPGGDKKDFLAYWLHKEGFSFAGISYPIDNPVFPKVYPNFTIRNWGTSTIEVAATLIETRHLSRHIIVMAWSMGGTIAESVNEAAKQNGIHIDLFVALDGTPPLPGLIPAQAKTIKPTPSGLADRVSLRQKIFLDSIHEENKLNQHIIIPDNIYVSQFLGNPPVALLNTPYRYNFGKFITDSIAAIKDSGAFDYKNYPLAAIIHGDSILDMQHALVDKSTWGMLNSQMLYRNYASLPNKNPTTWGSLYSLVNSLPDKLTRCVHGNHFFFIGQLGARNTVEQFVQLNKQVQTFYKQLESHA